MLRAYSKSEPRGKRLAGFGAHPWVSRDTTDYAGALFRSLGCNVPETSAAPERHPALVWAESGAMMLTGSTDGPPALAPGHLASCARATVRAFATLADAAATWTIDGAALLGERAALRGLTRRGTIAPGGSCRLLRARDGWIAVNLPRPEDIASIPAWLEIDATPEARGPLGEVHPWEAVAAAIATRAAAPLVARARLLGLAVAPAAEPVADAAPPWHRVVAIGPRAKRSPSTSPLVLDLSSLWAGPLATHLLALGGARVVKVEDVRRPDGARRGPARFFDLLNAGKESIVLDFATNDGRAALARLIAHADIVVESSRPRALAQLGADAARLVRARAGLTWISITGYGRRGRGAGWVAFGDDAAAAAGLATATGRLAGSPTPLVCGDAIADPLTGMHAALAALAAHRRGGGVLVSLALRDVAAHVAAFGPTTTRATVESLATSDGTPAWEVAADGDRQRVLPPRARPLIGVSRPFGADTATVLRTLRG
jgi:crotonobetainyl-CoA:carnitine CoA-transferase CaiB-like acyl-CoA transferase